MLIGRVVDPTPALNDVTTRSSNDSANASIAPAATAGASSGSVTCRNAPKADAPRSRAASSSCGSRFAARARTVIATYEMQNVMWAREICQIDPFSPNSWVKNASRLMPMMISGVMIGRSRSVWTAPEPRNRSRASPIPSSVPRIVEPTTAIAATWRVISSACSRSVLFSSRGYQSSVKPCQTNVRREELKLKMIRMAIGANRKT